ncbi:hypothetical protein P3W45_001665 [Vairimorpha bombi]|jgi:hypothetical protein
MMYLFLILSYTYATLQVFICALQNTKKDSIKIIICAEKPFDRDLNATVSLIADNKQIKFDDFRRIVDKRSYDEKIDLLVRKTKNISLEYEKWSLFVLKIKNISSYANADLKFNFYFGTNIVPRYLNFNINTFNSEYVIWSFYCSCPNYINQKVTYYNKNLEDRALILRELNRKIDKVSTDKTIKDILSMNINILMYDCNKRLDQYDRINAKIGMRGEFYKIDDRIKKEFDNKIYITYTTNLKMASLMTEIKTYCTNVDEFILRYESFEEFLKKSFGKFFDPIDLRKNSLKPKIVLNEEEDVEKILKNSFLRIKEIVNRGSIQYTDGNDLPI